MSSTPPSGPGDPTIMPGPADDLSGNALKAGTRLAEFEIVGLIGEGGFGIVYLAYDHSLDRKVALKEYMPTALAERQGGTQVRVKSQRNADTFSAGLRSFINEARLLAQFDHPALVKVYRFWVANGTAYMVMPYYQGITLKESLRRRNGAPDEAWLKLVLAQLLDALHTMHGRQCYHRDISPDNVLMLSDTTPVLLDFGAARRVIGNSAQTLTVILKPGYAPIEQYAEVPNLKQGPWTDIYALASVVYFAISGHTPPPAVARVISDPLVPLSQIADGRYSEGFVRGVDLALSVKPDDRPQDIPTFRALIGLTDSDSRSLRREVESEMEGMAPIPAPTTGPGARSTPTGRITQPSGQLRGTTTRATTATPAAPSPEVEAQIQRLLAQHIGPMAKIIYARAQKSETTGEGVIKSVAQSIDDDAGRAAFLADATKVLRGKRL